MYKKVTIKIKYIMKIIAHRGNDGIHKENSLEAIISSLNDKYTDGVEFDVRLTKDNKLIVNHDPFYNGNYIRHTNAVKLQKSGLNTLEEVLNNIHNNKIVMIEIKVDDKDIKIMSKKLISIIKKYNLNYYICSFNYQFIKHLKAKYKIKSGLIISLKINNKYLDNNFDFNSINYLYNKKVPSKETFRWTVNTKKELEKINKRENIITDNPQQMYKLIKDQEQF